MEKKSTMKQSEILFYARRYCSLKERECKDLYWKTFDSKWKEEADKWSDKFYEVNKELENAWYEETGETKEEVESYINDPFKLDSLTQEKEMNMRMTYRELVEWAEANTNIMYPEFTLAPMMDIVEEETGKWPNWSDEAPEWILREFGVIA